MTTDQAKQSDSEYPNLADQFRTTRLIQIFWVVEVGLVFLSSLMWASGNIYHGSVLTGMILALSSVYFLARKNKVDLGATLLLSFLTLLVCFFAWTNDGIRDESIMAFPGIIIFAGVLGKRRLQSILLTVMIVFLLGAGVASEFGVLPEHHIDPGMFSATSISIILLLTTISISLLTRDLKGALERLVQENVQVVSSQKRIEDLIYFDALTGLPNRILAKDRFNHAAAKSKDNGTSVGLLYLDLDDFKTINDSLGHKMGDEFLKHIARQLQGALKESDTVCRLGGDEFLVILEDIKSRNCTLETIEKIQKNLSEPLDIIGNVLVSSASIGIAFYPEDGTRFIELKKKADMAMYHAKQSGRNAFHYFDENMNQGALKRLTVSVDLRSAIENQELELYYQPKISLADNKVIGAEALIRWHHPENGLISPAVFIPIAESSGLITEIGNWVIDEACKHCAQLNGLERRSDFSMALNVSPIQFKRGNLQEVLTSAIQTHGVKAANIEVEFTESVLVDNHAEIEQILSSMKQSGIQFAIDDFGTGYSNLGYLKSFQIDTLKIDRSFISSLLESDKDLVIVNAIINLSKELGFSVVAEGVEDLQTANKLKDIGCDIGQGFYWAKPMTYSELEAFIQREYEIEC